MLGNYKIILRPLEPEDIDILYQWENDQAVWGISNTLLPFSKNILRQFIEIQSGDIYETRQTRFIIEARQESKIVGVLDLFDFDPYHSRAGIGILIYDKSDRQKGYAKGAINIAADYGFNILRLKQLYASVTEDNLASKNLFLKCGFEITGTKKAWINTPDGWADELFLQKINKKDRL
ncbi:MAG: GNAT family N-acetyltransferase [Rikenellaceae bacterium]|nr:GNAT family N-acetyltransferase [Rikenellaceae bacterium]